ncbi:hypothetical protein LTR53_006722 [Teratosphaeriaceae sp. CCFEE 6253]|nr:hypothetical protein LTR53_006722 [Teratosphaeriaceae sp. CCFEE 6253]
MPSEPQNLFRFYKTYNDTPDGRSESLGHRASDTSPNPHHSTGGFSSARPVQNTSDEITRAHFALSEAMATHSEDSSHLPIDLVREQAPTGSRQVENEGARLPNAIQHKRQAENSGAAQLGELPSRGERNNGLDTFPPAALVLPAGPRFVKAVPSPHLPWQPPRQTQGLPPIYNFALSASARTATPLQSPKRRLKKAMEGDAICEGCGVRTRTVDLEKMIQCCNRDCGVWYHLECANLRCMPQGRYGWSCENCDPDDQNNGLFSINDNVNWHGDSGRP